MEIITGDFYASDHVREDEIVETNIMLVLSKRESGIIEIESDFYVTETMQLVDGKLDSMYKNDWLPQFLKRKATDEEIKLFMQNRGDNELKHWSSFIRE